MQPVDAVSTHHSGANAAGGGARGGHRAGAALAAVRGEPVHAFPARQLRPRGRGQRRARML